MKKKYIIGIIGTIVLLLALIGCPQDTDDSGDSNNNNNSNAMSEEQGNVVASGLSANKTLTATIDGSKYQVTLNADTGLFTAEEGSRAAVIYAYAGEFFYYSETLQFRITVKDGESLSGDDILYMNVPDVKADELSSDSPIVFVATTKQTFENAKNAFHKANPLVMPTNLVGSWKLDLTKIDKSAYDEQTIQSLKELDPEIIYTFGKDGSISGQMTMTYNGQEISDNYDAFAYIITCTAKSMVYDVDLTQVLGAYMANNDITLIMPRIKADYEISGSTLKMTIDNGANTATNYFIRVDSSETTEEKEETSGNTDSGLNALVGKWQITEMGGTPVPDYGKGIVFYFDIKADGGVWYGAIPTQGMGDELQLVVQNVTPTQITLASYIGDENIDLTNVGASFVVDYTIVDGVMTWNRYNYDDPYYKMKKME